MGDDEPSGDQPGRRTNGTGHGADRRDGHAPREHDRPPRQRADEPGAREVYCTACGTLIDHRADLCPECGVRQPADRAGQGAPGNQGGQHAGGHRQSQQGGPRDGPSQQAGPSQQPGQGYGPQHHSQGQGHQQGGGQQQGHGHQQPHGQSHGYQQGHGPRGYGPQQGAHGLSPERRAELEEVANTDLTAAMVLGFLLTPAGYLLVGKLGLAVVNFVTFNYLFLGPIIVPFHVRSMIKDARQELRAAGVPGY